jgi:DNA-binding transcriptional regulator YiaG
LRSPPLCRPEARPQSRLRRGYCFEKPNEFERVVPLAAYLPTPIRIPVKPETVGDHLRLRRLTLKLFQKQVAERLGADTTSIHNWEVNAGQPALKYMPAIIEFLGYNPLPQAASLPERLVRTRTSMGLTQKESAARIGVDPSTLAKWERGEREPAPVFRCES